MDKSIQKLMAAQRIIVPIVIISCLVSGGLNLLYFFDVIPTSLYPIAFAIILIATIANNFVTSKINRLRQEQGQHLDDNTQYIQFGKSTGILFVASSLIWFITLIMVMFLK